MRYTLCLFFICSVLFSAAQSPDKIHRNAVLIDTHNDLLTSQTLEGRDIGNHLTEGHSDLYRLKQGGVDVQFFSVWTGEEPMNAEGFFKDAMIEIDSLEFIALRNEDKMILTNKFKSIKKGLRQNKLVGFIGVEGGHMIEDDLDKLETLYNRGMRYLTLTWNNSNNWATSARDETERASSLTHKGLTEFGKKVVQRMNQLGIMVDLSHVGEQTFFDALAVTSKPVILSHSSVYALCPHYRNVKDEQIKAVAANGGVICINFYSGFIGKAYNERLNELMGEAGKSIKDSLAVIYPDEKQRQEKWQEYFNTELEGLRPTLSQLVDHIDYIVKLVGDDYVGIGSDFDGVSSLPVGIKDVTSYPLITEELLKRGYTPASIQKILGKNVLRVMKANFGK
jgi:membrane dipeptidase